jgi:hypothetical protein
MYEGLSKNPRTKGMAFSGVKVRERSVSLQISDAGNSVGQIPLHCTNREKRGMR